MTVLSMLAAVLCISGVLICTFELGGTKSPAVRTATAVLCIGLSLRYACWRILFSMPHNQNILQTVWAWAFLIVELGAIVSSNLTTFFLSRSISRSPAADRTSESALHQAPVDVFIATYNESFSILERTAVAALAIDHSNMRVWILDDGNRAWVRDLAESLNIHYIARHKGKHAKAGNVNNGFQHAITTGRSPEFFLLLDADFAANRQILRRTLGLFEDPRVGIVQTPQHFFNPDPLQSNLFSSAVWPDEQRFFFNDLLAAKDAWGAAFCCGTSAVFRAEAFIAAGGMATETVTEDMLTTFKFSEFGYRTIFLNERLSLGLSPESIADFLSQRSRWCLGAIQQIFTRWSFFGRGSHSLINRVSFFDTTLYWIFGATFRIMLFVAPILWWFTGTAVLHASVADLLFWMAPTTIANMLFMGYLSKKRLLPLVSDIPQILTAFVITRTVATALIRPFGRAFKVTAKGVSTTTVTVQWSILWPFVLLASLGLGGLVLNAPRFGDAHGSSGYVISVVWTLLNAVVLSITALACVEIPRRRIDERFSVFEQASVRLVPISETLAGDPPMDSIACTLRDISLGGAALQYAGDWKALSGPTELLLDGGEGEGQLSLPVIVVDRRGDLLTIAFRSEPWIRRALIRKLFTGAYDKEVERIHIRQVLRVFIRTLLSGRATAAPARHATFAPASSAETASMT